MNNLELVEFCRSKLRTPYVYGAKGKELTEEMFRRLKSMYPVYVWDTDFSKIGKVCVDCSGLISWFTGKLKSSAAYHDEADEVHDISTISEAPVGSAVWRKGHIGVYIGEGKCIEARGSKYGVVVSEIANRDFTHWFLLKDIQYIKTVEYYPKYEGTSQSLVDALNFLGIDSSKTNRTKIANHNGYQNYLFSSEQNGYLLCLLKDGKLKK